VLSEKIVSAKVAEFEFEEDEGNMGNGGATTQIYIARDVSSDISEEGGSPSAMSCLLRLDSSVRAG
jgi:hypothetical protein